MNTELQRQRVTQFEQRRDRYLAARARASQRTLAADRQLFSTRYRALPALLVAPFGLLAVAGSLDLLFLLTGNSVWTMASFAMIPAGVAGVLFAIAVGLYDWFAAPAGSRVRGFGLWFAVGALLVLVVFTQSWVERFGVASNAGGAGVVLGFIGAALALMTGWLLGEYLDRLSALKPAESQAPIEVERLAEPVAVDEVAERRVANA